MLWFKRFVLPDNCWLSINLKPHPQKFLAASEKKKKKKKEKKEKENFPILNTYFLQILEKNQNN